MTPTEFIEQTAQKLIDQGGYAIDSETNTCAYKGDSGAGCAIGVWIVPAGLYNPEFEGKTIRQVMDCDPAVPLFFRGLIEMPRGHLLEDFLAYVQTTLHDSRVGMPLLTPDTAAARFQTTNFLGVQA